MRILFTRFPLESARGGAELQTITLMEGFRERGHGVGFLGSCPTLLTLCEERGFPAGELTIGPPPVTKGAAISFAWRQRSMKRRLENALAEFGDIDVICMLSMSEKLLLTESVAQKGMRVFWIEHDRIGRWLTQNPWLPQMRKAAEHATTVAVSKLTKDAYLKMGWPAGNVVDIVNGIAGARLEGKRIAQYDRLRIGTVARLSKDKGVDLLLHAMEDLPEIDCAIIGQGKEEEALRAIAKKLNDKAGRERVTIEPTAPDIGAFYRSLDAFVLASPVQDPCPLAPMEALWVGTPTILTDACGTAGYLRHNHDALIVRAGDVSALREGIRSLSNEAFCTQLATEGKKTAHALFSAERMINEYLSLFTHV